LPDSLPENWHEHITIHVDKIIVGWNLMFLRKVNIDETRIKGLNSF
jgi:hypothetical protein